jgi:hypothetical protein
VSIKINSLKAGVIAAAALACGENVSDLCQVMADEAKKRSPRDTGNNANSIAVKVSRGRKQEGRVFSQSGYGGWLEIGTTHMPAWPYIAPSYLVAKQKLGGYRA